MCLSIHFRGGGQGVKPDPSYCYIIVVRLIWDQPAGGRWKPDGLMISVHALPPWTCRVSRYAASVHHLVVKAPEPVSASHQTNNSLQTCCIHHLLFTWTHFISLPRAQPQFLHLPTKFEDQKKKNQNKTNSNSVRRSRAKKPKVTHITAACEWRWLGLFPCLAPCPHGCLRSCDPHSSWLPATPRYL